jgi:hypothetical protein
MVRSRLGLKVLGLCALALGLMAFASSAAQAEVGAHWNIIKANGELLKIELGSTLLPKLEIKEIESNTAELLFTTKGGTKVAILCTAAHFDEAGGGLLIAHGGLSLGRILFLGCITKLNGTLSSACKPKTTGKALGEILTEKGTGLIVLNGTEENVKITPDSGKLFAKLEMGLECSIGEIVNVETKEAGQGLWIKDCGGNASFLEEKVEHLIEESGTKGLIALGQPATIDGSAWVRLDVGTEHKGLKWGGTPA